MNKKVENNEKKCSRIEGVKNVYIMACESESEAKSLLIEYWLLLDRTMGKCEMLSGSYGCDSYCNNEHAGESI